MNGYIIEKLESLPSDVQNMVQRGHRADEAKSSIVCNYKPFSLAIKNQENEVLGVLCAYTAYAEVYVDDLWVKPECRKKGLARKLLNNLEESFRGKGFNNINLVTSGFQAPEFYKKCGFQVEFERVNKKNPKLTKTFFIKFFDDEVQTQGLLEP